MLPGLSQRFQNSEMLPNVPRRSQTFQCARRRSQTFPDGSSSAQTFPDDPRGCYQFCNPFSTSRNVFLRLSLIMFVSLLVPLKAETIRATILKLGWLVGWLSSSNYVFNPVSWLYRVARGPPRPAVARRSFLVVLASFYVTFQNFIFDDSYTVWTDFRVPKQVQFYRPEPAHF